MRVLVSHTGSVQADCALALRRYAHGRPGIRVEYEDCSGPVTAYGEAIAARWAGDHDLVLVEHDNEITAGVLPSFAACPEPWCVYGYEVFAPPWTWRCETGLGCTKFSAGLRRQFDFPALVMRGPCAECGCMHNSWGVLDYRTALLLGTRFQLSPHVHGTIRHFHPYQATEPGSAVVQRKPAVDVRGGFRRVTGSNAGIPAGEALIGSSAGEDSASLPEG